MNHLEYKLSEKTTLILFRFSSFFQNLHRIDLKISHFYELQNAKHTNSGYFYSKTLLKYRNVVFIRSLKSIELVPSVDNSTYCEKTVTFSHSIHREKTTKVCPAYFTVNTHRHHKQKTDKTISKERNE